jgi:hypothetical protein
MKEWNETEAQKAIEELIRRATQDSQFRALALADPPAAIAQINSTPLPVGFRVQIVARDGADMTVVVPDMMPADGELSDAELEQVAGGGGRCAGSCAESCLGTCEISSVA